MRTSPQRRRTEPPRRCKSIPPKRQVASFPSHIRIGSFQLIECLNIQVANNADQAKEKAPETPVAEDEYADASFERELVSFFLFYLLFSFPFLMLI